jgi:isoleucyl-tRNA synthetase
VGDRPLLDRWILSQLSQTVGRARERLEAYDATAAGREIQDFVEDLSNWYVRRSRRRFWNPEGEGGADSRAAFLTLHRCLMTVAELLAPFTPFIAEELWRNLAADRGGAPGSVHLADYPNADATALDPDLSSAMRAARTIVELGRRIRTESKVKVRQPLLEAVVHHPGDQEALRPLLDLVAEELNVKQVLFAGSAEQLGRWRAKPNFSVLGPRLGGNVKQVALILANDEGSLASALARGGSVTVPMPDGREVDIGPGEVELSQETKEGWALAAGSGIVVALELDLTPELRLEGLARELVRLVQDARRAADLEVTDRIALGLRASGDLAAAFATHSGYIAAETLATSLAEGEVAGATFRQEADVDGSAVVVTLHRS